MLIKLKNIADIRTGYTFRGALEDDIAGDVKVLQIRDIRQKTVVDVSELLRVKWEAGGKLPKLEHEDIVIAARGEHNTAAIFLGNELVVPSNQLIVVSSKFNNVLPGFICWSLNQPSAQRQLQGTRGGTNIFLLNKGELGDLEFKLPSLEQQRKILNLQQLWDEEQQILQQLQINRKNMLTGMFKKLLEK